jgi:hypothetical protein
MNEKVRTAVRARREFMAVLDPDFDDDDWKPLLGTPELHPDSWGAHDYVGVLSAEHFPYYGASQPYHQWRTGRPKTGAKPRLWGTPQVVERSDWHAPELIEVAGRFPTALGDAAPDEEPASMPEVERNWWPTEGCLMPVLRADEDYEYLRQRYGKSFWAVLLGYLNGRIEPWFRKDLERIKRCVIIDHD